MLFLILNIVRNILTKNLDWNIDLETIYCFIIESSKNLERDIF